jgi:hypothetical protein
MFFLSYEQISGRSQAAIGVEEVPSVPDQYRGRYRRLKPSSRRL